MPLFSNDPELLALLEHFHVLTGIRISIRDITWERIFAYPSDPTAFCSFMRTCSQTFNEKCMLNEHKIFRECYEKKKLIFFTCHAGLVGAVAPIIMGGELLGYIMFSHISDQKNDERFVERLQEYCHAHGVDNMPEEHIKKIKFRKQNQITAASKIMEAVVSYILQKELLRPRKQNFFFSFNQFLETHLSEEISVARICEEFHVSRTYLYAQLAEHSSTGVAGYIREKRLERAEHMLKHTATPITEIATAVGFTDYNYFLRVFKKRYGISPKSLRRSATQRDRVAKR